jgi:thioredoxin reductase (NADPH)
MQPQPAAPIETDALVIGAGPVGLYQVFELGLLEIRAHVVDALPVAGGQCIELYPDKPIYDMPGIPMATGREMVARLLKQLEPFSPVFHLEQKVSRVRRRDDRRFDVETSAGQRFLVKAVVIAGGAGAFEPRRLKVEGIDRFEGSQLFYDASEARQFAGQEVVIVGGGDAALDAAARLADASAHPPRSVTLVHRRDAFQASAQAIAKVSALRESKALRFVAGQVEGFQADDSRLRRLHLTTGDETMLALAVDTLLVMQGLSPKLGPLAQWGLAMERKQLVVETASFETSEPGIFAVGDVNTYPGKKKLIVCGFHEATLASYGAAAYVHPDREVMLQYTTTSTRLHKLLGVHHPTGD